jgi:hypothetical protein
MTHKQTSNYLRLVVNLSTDIRRKDHMKKFSNLLRSNRAFNKYLVDMPKYAFSKLEGGDK